MTVFRIERAGLEHAPEWALLRAELWSDASVSEHAEGIVSALANAGTALAAFVGVGEAGLLGFAEVSLRGDYVNGCDTAPVAFLEGVYVQLDSRGLGVARRLCEAVEAWRRDQGCRELGSDTELENTAGQAFHAAQGFEEWERVVFYRKKL